MKAQDMNTDLDTVIEVVEELRDALTNSYTKSRYVSDGIFSMYVLLIPAPNGGGMVMSVDVDEDLNYGSVISAEAFDNYDKADQAYQEVDL